MAIPESYTAHQLAVFAQAVLGPTATALGWVVGSDDAGDYAEIVTDTLLSLGISDLSEATDIAALRAVARWQVWRWAADALASKHNISTDGQSLSRSQLHEQAIKARDAAYAAAMSHMASYGVTATRIVHLDDPHDGPIRYRAQRGW